MKSALFTCLVSLIAACSVANESSRTQATSQLNAGQNFVIFAAKNRCLSSPYSREVSGRYVSGTNPYRHGPCGTDNQSFLFRNGDIKEAGHFGPYLTEVQGKVIAGSSSPWSVEKNAAGRLVIKSGLSDKCLVATVNSTVVLGSCDDVHAEVRLEQVPTVQSSPRATGVVACSTDNQGNAVDCI